MGNVLVASTPANGDTTLDAEFTAREYLFVLVGYRARQLHLISSEGSEPNAG